MWKRYSWALGNMKCPYRAEQLCRAEWLGDAKKQSTLQNRPNGNSGLQRSSVGQAALDTEEGNIMGKTENRYMDGCAHRVGWNEDRERKGHKLVRPGKHTFITPTASPSCSSIVASFACTFACSFFSLLTASSSLLFTFASASHSTQGRSHLST